MSGVQGVQTMNPPAVERAAEATGLVLRGIVKHWRGAAVLNGVDLDVEPGKITWLGGRNGAGKTTLIRVAAGLILPEAGSISLNGIDPNDDRRAFQRQLGYLPAGNASLYARLSARRNLEFWGGMALLRKAERAVAIERAIERFDLHDLADRRVDRISMGQRQRVRLAASFLHEPRLVLLDEPYTSLDDEAIALMRAKLDDLVAEGGSVLWCSPSKVGTELSRDVGYVLADGKLERT